MPETDKTRERFMAEMVTLRQRVATLEAALSTQTQTEAALRASERRYRHLMEHSLGLLCIHDLDGILLEVNTAAARTLGYHPRDGVGKSLREFIAPAVRHEFDAYLERIRQHSTDNGILRVVTRTGKERVWLYRNIRYEAPHEAPHVLGHALDITEWTQAQQTLKQAHEVLEQRVAERTAVIQRINTHLQAEIAERQSIEQALRASEAHFSALVQHASDIIALLTADGTVRYYSPAIYRILGHEPESMIGHHIFGALHPDDVWPVKRVMAQLMQCPGAIQTVECRVRHRDGSWRYLEAVGSHPSAPHRAGCIVVNARDVTERKLAENERQSLEAQLHQMQKMHAVGTLAGGIAHEFNNMLAVILGFTQLAITHVSSTDPVCQYLQEVYAAGNRAKDLVLQLLAFSRPSVYKRESIPLAGVIQQALKLLRPSLPATIDIRQQIAPEAGRVLANANQIHQVLMNLCANAEYAMRETGGILEISVDNIEVDDTRAAFHPDLQPGPFARLQVRDTGAGIPPDVMARIFEPFFSTKGVGNGTGMGLAIVHGIITSHGGVIEVESIPGAGTAFTIYLPRMTDIAPAPPHETVRPTSQRKGRILFVDDEAILARLGQTLLINLGYEVDVFTSSVAALQTFQDAPDQFDLVITDHTMPTMTGATLVEALRRIRPDIPIVLCTGFSHTMNAEKAQALGVDAFIMKPDITQALGCIVQQVFESHRHRA